MDSDLGVLAGRGASRQIGRPGNRVRPGRPRPKGIDMRLSLPVMLMLLSLVFVSFADLAFANSFRGNWLCSDADFKIVKQDYRSDSTSVYYRIGYAHCLIVKGKDSEGLAILHNIVDHSTHPARVKAAFMVAEYISTGGIFEDTTDEDNINEAIKAYGRVIFFISLDPDYSNTNDLFEAEAQIELTSHYRLPLLYSEKFKKGATGTDNIHLLSSPSYNGDRDLKTYPEYSPYTIDSLEKAIEFANQCLVLPLKRHFQSSSYRNYKAGCQVLKEAAQDSLPLERQRLVLLDTDSCSNDLPQCLEHQEIKSEMVSIIRQAGSELRQIF